MTDYDCSLDDLIHRKNGRRSFDRRPRGGGFRRRSFDGPRRFSRGGRGNFNRSRSGDRYFSSPKLAGSPLTRGTTDFRGKLLISNLAESVTESDLAELFGEFGELRSSTLNHNRLGLTIGTAEVVFGRREHALKAVAQYNGVPLDGKPMRIQMAVSEVSKEEDDDLPKVRIERRDRFPRGGGFGNRGGGRVEKRNRPKFDRDRDLPTAEELDMEIDQYREEHKMLL